MNLVRKFSSISKKNKIILSLACGWFFSITCMFFVIGVGIAKAERVEWDQQEAVRRVKSIIAQEKAHNFAWDNIDWTTDPGVAIELAQKKKKPIFLYFYLKGNVGPKEAPC